MWFRFINLVCIIRAISALTEVSWKADTEVFQFGKDAQLMCSGSKCKKNVPKLWMGGLPYNLLGTDRRSANPDKYETRSEQKENFFMLMIKDISIADLNCNYTCTCGFFHFTSILQASKYFLYPPDTEPIHSSFSKEDDIYHIIVNISRVYPLPSCKIVLEYGKNENTNDALPILGGNIIDGIYSNLEIKRRINCNEYHSQIAVTITCTVRNKKYAVFSEKIDCSNNDVVIRVVLSCFLAYAVVVALVCWILRKHLYKKCKYFKEVDKRKQQTSNAEDGESESMATADMENEVI